MKKTDKEIKDIDKHIDIVIQQTKKKIRLLEELRNSVLYERAEYVIRKSGNQFLLYKKTPLKQLECGTIDKVLSYLKKRKISNDKVFRETHWEHIISSDDK